MKKHRKKPAVPSLGSVELNVMPFIDVFSLLCTFLLFSAVWVAIGILEVQVPFLTNAPSPKNDKPEREIEVSVSVSGDKLTVASSFSLPPVDKNSSDFPNTPEGRDQMHEALVKLKKDNLKTDKVKLFVEDEVLYQNLVLVLDLVKFSKPGDQIPMVEGDNPLVNKSSIKDSDLFPKVIMASVIL